jgi:hypothetical protein
METVCHNQLRFESLFSREVIADFAGGRITSDAGGLVLRELDQRYRFAEDVARCLHDPRDSHKVKHDLLTLVRQRLFAIAQGYEDNNDAATLAKDPAFKIMAGDGLLRANGDPYALTGIGASSAIPFAQGRKALSSWIILQTDGLQ